MNCGIGDAAQNAKGLEAAMNEMALITGQRPVKTRARNSIATFKIREGQPLGIAVTLRGNVSLLYSQSWIMNLYILWSILFLICFCRNTNYLTPLAGWSYIIQFQFMCWRFCWSWGDPHISITSVVLVDLISISSRQLWFAI